MSLIDTRSIKRSRKNHRCSLCFERIEIGTPYCRRAGVSIDYEFFSMKMHPECAEKEYNMPFNELESWYEFPDGPLCDRPKACEIKDTKNNWQDS